MKLGLAYALGGGATGLEQGIGAYIAQQREAQLLAMQQQEATDRHNTAALALKTEQELAPFRKAAFLHSNQLFPTTAIGAVGTDSGSNDGGDSTQPSAIAPGTPPSTVGAGSVGAAVATGNRPQLQVTPPGATASSGPKAPAIPPVMASSKGKPVTSQVLTSPMIDYGDGVSSFNPTGATYQAGVSSGLSPSDAALLAANPQAAAGIQHLPNGSVAIGKQPTKDQVQAQKVQDYLQAHPADAKHPIGVRMAEAQQYARQSMGTDVWRDNANEYVDTEGRLAQIRANAALQGFEGRQSYKAAHPNVTGHMASIMLNSAQKLADGFIEQYGSATNAQQAVIQDPAAAKFFTDMGVAPEQVPYLLNQAEGRARQRAVSQTVQGALQFGNSNMVPLDSAETEVQKLQNIAKGQIRLPAVSPPPPPKGKPLSAADQARAKAEPGYAAWLKGQGYQVP